ncbi:MAG: hypothetical protein U0Q11_00590 [Vicinamibacterales bacterium]
MAVSHGAADGATLSRTLDWLDRAEPLYLLVCAVAAIAVLARGFGEITSLTDADNSAGSRGVRCSVLVPYALFYALPWAFGMNPPLALQLTAIPLGLVPLSFASAIVRYRLRDVEVIFKRGLAYGVPGGGCSGYPRAPQGCRRPLRR